jgi:anti-anti-sigma factor
MTFPTEVDASNSIRLGTELFAVCRPDVSVVIADLSSTEFCDSSAVRFLIAAHDQARACGVELRVVARSAAVLRLLELTGAELVLDVYPDLPDALLDAPRTTNPAA